MAVHSIVAFVKTDRDSALNMQAFKPYDPMADGEDLKETYQHVLPAGRHFLGQWVRGDDPARMPAGVGKALHKGDTIELRIRYDEVAASALSVPAEDRSKVGLYFASEPARRMGETIVLENHSFTVPVGAQRHEVRASGEVVRERGTYLYGAYPHLGRAASDVEVLVHYPDGRSVTVLYVPEFDYVLNHSYIFAEPLFAPAGARLEVIAHYDNSGENPYLPYDPPRDLKAPVDARLVVYVDGYTSGKVVRADQEDETKTR